MPVCESFQTCFLYVIRTFKSAQEVIITAAIRNIYPIVKVLKADGYKIIDKVADDRFIFKELHCDIPQSSFKTVDFMERHVNRIRIFKGESHLI